MWRDTSAGVRDFAAYAGVCRVSWRVGWGAGGRGCDAPPGDVLAQALEANRQLARLAEELRAENARLREEAAHREAELEQVKAALGVLQRMVFGRSSERSRPQAAGRDGTARGLAETGTARAEGPGGAGRARGRDDATGHACRTPG